MRNERLRLQPGTTLEAKVEQQIDGEKVVQVLELMQGLTVLAGVTPSEDLTIAAEHIGQTCRDLKLHMAARPKTWAQVETQMRIIGRSLVAMADEPDLEKWDAIQDAAQFEIYAGAEQVLEANGEIPKATAQ